MIVGSADMRGFFCERLDAALAHQHLAISPGTHVYLLELLTSYANVAPNRALATPLVERLAEASAASSAQERFRMYRDMGDAALYSCGFFADHLERRGVSRKYVVGMGGRAYVAAGGLARSRRGGLRRVLPELAHKFEMFACVLDEVRETTALRTPQDIVRLYERWRKTGSRLLAERLEKEGVFPQHNPRGHLH